MAKDYYEMTGIKLEQVLLRHAKRDREEDLVRAPELVIPSYQMDNVHPVLLEIYI